MNNFKLSFISLLIVSGTCLKQSELKLSMDYFKFKDPSFICLLVCKGDGWSQKFAKTAFETNIAVSAIDLDNIEDSFGNLRSCLQQQYTNIGILLDLQCPNFHDILYWASEELFLSGNHNWLIIENDDYLENELKINSSLNVSAGDMIPLEFENAGIINNETINILNNLNLSVDADIVVACKKDSASYSLYDVFNFGNIQGGQLNVTALGTWTENEGLRMQNAYKYIKRWNFQNLPLRVIVVSTRPNLFQPDMVTTRTMTLDVNVITRIASSIFNVVAEQHNIRLTYSVTDRWIGTFNKNSSRVVANSLYFREQDFTPLLRMSRELVNKIDFLSQPLCFIETKYYYRIPNYGVGKFENQFLTPLTTGSWGCIITVSVLCSLILFLAAKFECRPWSIQYAIFTVIASVCQQFFEDDDENQARRTSSGGTEKQQTTIMTRKLTVLVTGISCVLLYNYYTSSVVSWLLSGPPPSINSLQELLESPLELIFEDVGYTKSWLQTPGYYFNKRNAKIEDALRTKKVFAKKKDAPLLLTLEQGIEMVKAGGYAFHAQVANANTRISQTFDTMELCELGSLQSMETTALYPSLPKNSPYKEFFAWSVTILRERGIVSCIQRRMGSPDISCDGSVPRALALGGAAPAFILLAVGYLIAVGVLMAEKFLHRRKQKKNSEVIPFVN